MKNKLLFNALIGLIASTLLFSPISAHANNLIFLNGKLVEGRIYVPLRSAGEKMGSQINWNGKTQTATITMDGKKLESTVGKNARLFNGRVYVQLRAIAETFFDSKIITWDSSSLYAYSDKIVVSVAPLTKDEAMNIMYTAIAKANNITSIKQKRTYLQTYFTDRVINTIIEKGGFELSHPFAKDDSSNMRYKSLTSLEISQETVYEDENRDYYIARVEGIIIKKGDRWLVDSLIYTNEGSLGPH